MYFNDIMLYRRVIFVKYGYNKTKTNGYKMKVVIDLVEDLRESINDSDEFILGAIAIQKALDDDGNALLAWGKAVTRMNVDEEKKRLNFYVEEDQVMHLDEVLEKIEEMSNEQMLYPIYVSTKENEHTASAPLIGFNEDTMAKQYMLIIEE